MLLDEFNLCAVTWVICNYLLDSAAFCHLENVRGLAQIKRHHLLTHVMNHGLWTSAWQGKPASPREHTESSKDSKQNTATGNQQEATFVVS